MLTMKAIGFFEALFDLVITDMTMPELTGDKIVTEMKKVRPEIPVILCTGLSEEMANGMASAVRPDKSFLLT